MFFTPLVERDSFYVIRLFIFIQIKMANLFQCDYSALSTLANKRVVFNNKGLWSMELFLTMKEQTIELFSMIKTNFELVSYNEGTLSCYQQ